MRELEGKTSFYYYLILTITGYIIGFVRLFNNEYDLIGQTIIFMSTINIIPLINSKKVKN